MNSSMGGTTLPSDAAGSFTGGPVLRLGFDGVMLLGQSTQIRLKNIRFEGNRALYPNGTAVRFAKTANTDDMDAMVDDCEFEGLHIRPEEHTSELQPLLRIPLAVFGLKKQIHMIEQP